MFVQNDDLSIYVTRGDECDITFSHAFKKGDVVRFKVTKKKDCGTVMLQRDFNVTASGDMFTIHLEGDETKLGEVISKPTDFWYEVELNPDTDPNTIIGYDEDGAKILRLYPEGKDVDGDDIEVVGSKTLQELVDYALEEAKNSGEFKGDPGYTPVRGKDYWTESDKNEIKRELEETTLGDIESALDSIIAIQEELINNGGSSDDGYYCDNCGEHMDDLWYCDNCGTSYSQCEWCGTRYNSDGPPPCGCDGGMDGSGWYETCPDCGEEFYAEGGPHDGCSGGETGEWEGPWFDCPNCGCGWGEYPESDTVTCPDCGHTWQYE